MTEKIDLSKVKSMKCIFCGKEVKEIHSRPPRYANEPEISMWDGGVVERINMPYGSMLDGNIYIICICDECIKKNNGTRSLMYAGTYI